MALSACVVGISPARTSGIYNVNISSNGQPSSEPLRNTQDQFVFNLVEVSADSDTYQLSELTTQNVTLSLLVHTGDDTTCKWNDIESCISQY